MKKIMYCREPVCIFAVNRFPSFIFVPFRSVIFMTLMD